MNQRDDDEANGTKTYISLLSNYAIIVRSLISTLIEKYVNIK